MSEILVETPHATSSHIVICVVNLAVTPSCQLHWPRQGRYGIAAKKRAYFEQISADQPMVAAGLLANCLVTNAYEHPDRWTFRSAGFIYGIK